MARTNRKAAKKYAAALFKLYPPEELEPVSEALAELAQTFAEHSALRVVLRTPSLDLKSREAALREICSRIHPEDVLFSNFAVVLLRNNRLTALPQVSQAFDNMLAEYRRILRLDVATAADLPPEERDAFVARMQNEFGPMLSVNWLVNEEILGGLIIKVGDRVLDSSVRGSLEQMRGYLLN